MRREQHVIARAIKTQSICVESRGPGCVKIHDASVLFYEDKNL